MAQTKPAYNFATSDNWMPYSSAEDPQGGILVMIAKAASKAANQNITVSLVPWARALHGATTGYYSGVIGDWYSEERARDFLFSEPILTTKVVFIARGDRHIAAKYTNLKDLLPYKIGVVRDNSFIPTLTKAGLKLDYATDLEANIKKLAYGRVDLLVDEDISTMRLIATKFPDLKTKVITLQPPLEENQLYLIVSKKIKNAQEIINQFNAGLAIIKKRGTIKQILESYGLNQ